MSLIEETPTSTFTQKIFLPDTEISESQLQNIVEFLHKGLEQYGDPEVHIRKAIDYALQRTESPGGFVASIYDGDAIIGAVVINRTGMSGYIPENILVYIAIDRTYRGRGIGKMLMQTAIETSDGDIALHVEADNPAKFLYEKLGFENKYLEMRLQKTSL